MHKLERYVTRASLAVSFLTALYRVQFQHLFQQMMSFILMQEEGPVAQSRTSFPNEQPTETLDRDLSLFKCRHRVA